MRIAYKSPESLIGSEIPHAFSNGMHAVLIRDFIMSKRCGGSHLRPSIHHTGFSLSNLTGNLSRPFSCDHMCVNLS